MRDARKAGPATQQIAESIAKKHGARVTPINYKSGASIARKLKGGNEIKDAARTTIIVSRNKLDKVVADLQKHSAVDRYKPQLAKNYEGYSGHLFNLKIKGVTTEIQVNTPEMIFAKEPMRVVVKLLGKKDYQRIRKETGQFAGWGHKYYEDLRSLPSDNPKRRKGNSSKIDSRNYYDNFRK